MRSRVLIVWLSLLNAGCLSTGHRTPARTVDLRNTPDLSTISAKVAEAYQRLDRYWFDALLHRQWRVKGETVERENFAIVKMGLDTVITRVFDSAGPDKKMIAFITKKKGEDTRFPMDRREDGCLSGSLGKSWIGPSPSADLPIFAARIEAGRYEGTEDIDGRTHYVIKHDLVFEQGEYYRRVDTYYIDTQTYRMTVWKNDDYEKPTGMPIMTCTRTYTERVVRESP